MFIRKAAFIAPAAVALAALAPAGVAYADRGPSKEESAAIASALTAEGFKSWEKVELDDGVWEIDDARKLDGKKYDVKLNPQFQVIRVDRD